MSKIKEYITPREAAEIIGCSSATVRNYIKQGVVNARKVGGRIYIKRTALRKMEERYKALEPPCGYITVREAARRLRVVPATIHALIGQGRLEHTISAHKSGGGFTRWVVDSVPDFSRWMHRADYADRYGVSHDCVLLQAAKQGFNIKSYAGYIYLRKPSDSNEQEC